MRRSTRCPLCEWGVTSWRSKAVSSSSFSSSESGKSTSSSSSSCSSEASKPTSPKVLATVDSSPRLTVEAVPPVPPRVPLDPAFFFWEGRKGRRWYGECLSCCTSRRRLCSCLESGLILRSTIQAAGMGHAAPTTASRTPGSRALAQEFTTNSERHTATAAIADNCQIGLTTACARAARAFSLAFCLAALASRKALRMSFCTECCASTSVAGRGSLTKKRSIYEGTMAGHWTNIHCARMRGGAISAAGKKMLRVVSHPYPCLQRKRKNVTCSFS